MVPFFQLLLGLAAIVSANTTTTGSQLACRTLSTGPLSTFVKSSGAEFQAGAASAWNLLNVELTPACIVFPETTEHVSIAMTAIHSFKATYAIQSGGHSAMQGWNNVQAGVLIHFMNMRNISHDQASSSVTFQPGLTWGEALDALEPLGVAVAGGRVSDVGTGLLLGGGLSFLASAVGYSVDTLREVDVVLVTGKIVTATVDNEYADLFRALKGGANRFGIYDNSSAEVLLEALARFPKHVDDPKAAFMFSFLNSFSDGVITPSIMLTAFYEGTSLSNSSFGDFLAIPSIQTNLTALSYYDISNIIADEGPPPVVELYGASVLQGSDDVVPYREIFALYTQFCQTAKDELAMTTLSFTPVMDSQIKAGRARGGNAIDAPHGGFHLVQFSLSLPPVQKISALAWLQPGRPSSTSEAPRTPGLPLYVAESDKNQHVFETYGGYEFLKQTYRKYDPERFNVQYTDGPIGL
ncbi:FAD-binding domain-containing protein [Mycena rosella]|uniref:FAD-binding domain-containing protein n=1 Tax=Mycena rosella TaxID=1033263 RepID=A0AAD7GWE5_MYCRO|nr:FAD-binding domain-containing protein [Mycena rosella]